MNLLHRLVPVFTLMCWLSSTSNTLAQGTILFLNGKEKRYTSYEVKGDFIHYVPEGTDGSWNRRADKLNVFSVIPDSGPEKVIYEPDTTDSFDPTVDQVRDYIRGEKYATTHYKKPMNFVGGMASGMAGSIFGFYGIPVPLVYATVVGRFNPDVPASPEGEVYSESFQAGYQKKSRNIKIKNSLIGGGVGFAVGFGALLLIYAND